MILLNKNIVLAIADVIIENKQYLSDIDGLIGDGDHGVNMAKGFNLAKERILKHSSALSFSQASEMVADALCDDIGGSMGPIYGTLFSALSEKLPDSVDINQIYEAFFYAQEELMDISDARLGDKTLMDTLIVAIKSMHEALQTNLKDEEVLEQLRIGAKKGWESTEQLTAKYGRAARLGERSIGVLDAGATSCWLIINTFTDFAISNSRNISYNKEL